MLKVGLTGGIGSGKSTIARIFEVIGVPVYYADEAAKRLMNEDEPLKKEIAGLLGKEAYKDGKVNRRFISEQVFRDRSKLEKLNKLVHPVTIRDAAEWMQKQQSAYAIKEAALIFESGSQSELDKVIGVFAPVSLRVRRVMQRDQADRESVLGRMRNQIEERIKMKLCDYVIQNDEEQLVIPQVLEIHRQLLILSQTQKING